MGIRNVHGTWQHFLAYVAGRNPHSSGIPCALCACSVLLQVHPSLVINMDQTGVRLVPSASWTYEKMGSKAVAVAGAEDKRQITACLASALDGSMPPLQLIFQGKTALSLPPATAASTAARIHLTLSDNHWSNLDTMKQWITQVLMPHADRAIEQHQLRADAAVILVLDVWSVHRGEPFREFLRAHHPRVHLVFVPANCTSELQVADVALQRPFKSHIRAQFDLWAAGEIKKQIDEDKFVGFKDMFLIRSLRPLILQWCIDSWHRLTGSKQLVLSGWAKCCTSLYDVMDPEKRIEAVTAVANQELDAKLVPAEHEASDAHDTDQDDDELDVGKPVAQGRRSARARQPRQPARGSFMLNSQRIAMSDSSDSD